MPSHFSEQRPNKACTQLSPPTYDDVDSESHVGVMCSTPWPTIPRLKGSTLGDIVKEVTQFVLAIAIDKTDDTAIMRVHSSRHSIGAVMIWIDSRFAL